MRTWDTQEYSLTQSLPTIEHEEYCPNLNIVFPQNTLSNTELLQMIGSRGARSSD